MSNKKVGPVTELRERLELLEKRLKELNADYLRALSDFDNFRKRTERDLVVQQRAGIELLLEALIPVLDNFERALNTFSASPPNTEMVNDFRENWKKGVELIYKQLYDLLAQFGLRDYTCLGKEFDPRRAEAIGFLEVEGGKENQVIEEVCKGYECAGRVIRPAKVMVARPRLNEKISEEKGESKS